MSRRPSIKAPRKPPQQSRSKATVTTILDAAVRVLDREGADAATTTRIAEVAGVSVGTLYQYFGNRDSILDALQDREFERATQFMASVLTESGSSAEQIARRVIEGLLELYAACPALHRLLVVEGLRVTPTDRVQAFDLRMVSGIRAFLSSSGLPIRRHNHDVAAFVIYHSVRATMLARLLEAPPGVGDRVLVDEVTDLVLSYLVGTPAARQLQGVSGAGAAPAPR
jgi:AcrR family transcriptional regulator